MPKPKKNETKQEFISRCMAYNDMQKYDQKQRAAICYSYWDKSKEENSMRKVQREAWADATFDEYKNMIKMRIPHMPVMRRARKTTPEEIIDMFEKDLMLAYKKGMSPDDVTATILDNKISQAMSMRQVEKIIEITRPIKIEQKDNVIFLEKGDRIKVLNETMPDGQDAWEIEVSLRDVKKAIDILHDRQLDQVVNFTSTNSFEVTDYEDYEYIELIFDEYDVEYYGEA